MLTNRRSCPCEVCKALRKGIISAATNLPKRPRYKYPLVNDGQPVSVRVVEGERAEVIGGKHDEV